MEARRMFKGNMDDINLKNEPFEIIGKIIPIYDGVRWSFKLEEFENKTSMCFPDKFYNYDEMRGMHVFIGVYEDNKCVGMAILRHSQSKYMYIYDLKVLSEYRRKGAAKELINLAKEIAKDNGYLGLYGQAQDNNLIACRFYFKNGFKIGGIDTKIYNGTDYQNNMNISFYLDI